MFDRVTIPVILNSKKNLNERLYAQNTRAKCIKYSVETHVKYFHYDLNVLSIWRSIYPPDDKLWIWFEFHIKLWSPKPTRDPERITYFFLNIRENFIDDLDCCILKRGPFYYYVLSSRRLYCFLVGAAAAMALLKGAAKLEKQTKGFNYYVKKGTSRTAYRDFMAVVDPESIIKHKIIYRVNRRAKRCRKLVPHNSKVGRCG